MLEWFKDVWIIKPIACEYQKQPPEVFYEKKCS